MTITPQPGFQTSFLETPADIAIGGGAAGAGKSWALLIEPLRHVHRKGFIGIIFRRTMKQATQPGSIQDASQKIYPLVEPQPDFKASRHLWKFPNGSSVSFGHLEHEKNKNDHQGAEYAFIGFDELTHFSETQFWYIISRNRSTCGIRPYVRATCNPKADSWVKNLIQWWIDEKTGFPIPERAGVLRYFLRDGGNMIWGDTKEEVMEKGKHILENFPKKEHKALIKSMTFIPGKVQENIKLLQADPGYLSNLLAQDEEEQARLLKGNWNATLDGLNMADPEAVNDLFTNIPPEEGRKFVTCDVAREGADFAVIAFWQGWQVYRLEVFTKSPTTLIVETIEKQRKADHSSRRTGGREGGTGSLAGTPKRRVLIDQDGVGGGVVDQGKYKGFSGGSVALKDRSIKEKENYQNLKTQLYYRFCERRLNEDWVSIDPKGIYVDGKRTDWIRYKGRKVRVIDLIKQDFNQAARKKDVDKDGKKRMISKDEQKARIGRSPDFSDALVLREWFELKKGGSVSAGNV